jgi:hypothetical protein
MGSKIFTFCVAITVGTTELPQHGYIGIDRSQTLIPRERKRRIMKKAKRKNG